MKRIRKNLRGAAATRGRVRHGVTRLELLVAIAMTSLLLAVVIPIFASVRMTSLASASLDNLIQIGVAHAVYAADWNGRQVTLIADDISVYGDDPGGAFDEYNDLFEPDHPDPTLGWGCQPDGSCGLWRYPVTFPSFSNFAEPVRFSNFSIPPLGGFRFLNGRPLHEYIDGRVYSPTFYAPADTAAWAVVSPAFDDWQEFVTDLAGAPGPRHALTSYSLSAAAMYPPDVMRSAFAGGWQNPWLIDHGFTSPGLYQARYPDLKTDVIEHHWNQNRPEEFCNEAIDTAFGYYGCEPYYFNHGFESAPATLFYDLSTRLFSNQEAIAADTAVKMQSGLGLWSRDTPFGTTGYTGDLGYDGTITSHHILTTDGILGRDTIAPARPDPLVRDQAFPARPPVRLGRSTP